jgi:uncharacterized protein YbcI
MTKGQFCDKIAKEITKFYVSTLKYGPKEAKCYIIEDMVVVRFKGHLLPVEKEILNFADKNTAIELVKNIRKVIHQITTKKLSAIVEKIVKIPVLSCHSDISTVTGERIEIFVLKENLEKKLNGG